MFISYRCKASTATLSQARRVTHLGPALTEWDVEKRPWGREPPGALGLGAGSRLRSSRNAKKWGIPMEIWWGCGYLMIFMLLHPLPWGVQYMLGPGHAKTEPMGHEIEELQGQRTIWTIVHNWVLFLLVLFWDSDVGSRKCRPNSKVPQNHDYSEA